RSSVKQGVSIRYYTHRFPGFFRVSSGLWEPPKRRMVLQNGVENSNPQRSDEHDGECGSSKREDRLDVGGVGPRYVRGLLFGDAAGEGHEPELLSVSGQQPLRQ